MTKSQQEVSRMNALRDYSIAEHKRHKSLVENGTVRFKPKCYGADIYVKSSYITFLLSSSSRAANRLTVDSVFNTVQALTQEA